MKPQKRFPITVLTIIAASMAAMFVTLARPDFLVFLQFNPQTPSFRTAVSSLFVHQNLLHLLGNMMFLAAVGPAVESAAGSFRFALVYFIGGLLGVFGFWIFHSTGTLVGASACVSSCVAYYSVRYHDVRVPLAPKVSLPIGNVIGIWILLQVAGAFIGIGEYGAVSATAYWSHLSGFAGGLILSFVFRAPVEAHSEKVADHNLHAGELSTGASLAVAELNLKSDPNNVEALTQKASAQRTMGDREGEIQTIHEAIDITYGEDLGHFVERLRQLNALSTLGSLELLKRSHQVREEQFDCSVEMLKVVAYDRDDGQRPEALLELAAVCRDIREDEFRRATTTLTELFPLHPATDVARSRGYL